MISLIASKLCVQSRGLYDHHRRSLPDRCIEWMYEFRVDGATGPAWFELAYAAWNDMPRANDAQQEKTE
jgi:hypothetical protein